MSGLEGRHLRWLGSAGLARWIFGLSAAALALAAPGGASAAELRFGYRAGLTQTVGTSVTNDQAQLVVGTATQAAGSARLQGLQFATNVSGNLSFDVLTSIFDHALVLGAGFTQTVPAGVPDDAAGTLRDGTSTIEASAQYIARSQQPTWGFGLGGGYTFLSNGRLVAPANGATPGTTGQTAPGDQLSNFVLSGRVHTFNAIAEAQLLRLRWDADLRTTYTYTINGVFNLAPATLGTPANGQAAAATNIGAFIPASTHTVAPALTVRSRLGARGLFTASAFAAYTRPVDIEDRVCNAQGDCVTVSRAATLSGAITSTIASLPDTLNTLGSLAYLRALTPDRNLGVEARATFGMRVKDDPETARRFASRELSPDSLIVELLASYSDRWPWELRFTGQGGAAMPYLFQPPLGALEREGPSILPLRGDVTPVFNLSLTRFFDPVTTVLSVARALGPGALGASAVVAETASLTFGWQPKAFRRTMQVNLGVNANRTRGVDRDRFVTPVIGAGGAIDAVALAFNNVGAGANAGLTIPLFEEGELAGLLSGAYTFSWLDPDPDASTRPPITTNGVLVTFTLVFGRGTLRELGTGRSDSAQLSAFATDPANGSPLTSARLVREGAPLLDGTSGTLPGVAPETRRDSRQAYEEERRRDQSEHESQKRSGAVQGSENVQDEEQRTEEEQDKEREEREKKRTRKFSEWPMGDVKLPKK